MERLMTIKELAEYLQLEEHTIYKMARKGEIPAYKVAGQWRFKKEMIEEWLEQKLVSNGEKGRQEKC
ncbi:MAG TPA: DNA-binding protein [Candidatus Desulfofervidus auxilii]|uniref:DNA-binding protein n=1 Tax=Desulfofervidus auxilii TaxID=1621989 RepID=A0A7V1I3U9_DESA2|nr:DNA-binding protein [Candidatus Desulfofervidus auxilii]